MMAEKKKKQPAEFAKDKNAFTDGSSIKGKRTAQRAKQKQSGAHQPRDADVTSGHDVQKLRKKQDNSSFQDNQNSFQGDAQKTSGQKTISGQKAKSGQKKRRQPGQFQKEDSFAEDMKKPDSSGAGSEPQSGFSQEQNTFTEDGGGEQAGERKDLGNDYRRRDTYHQSQKKGRYRRREHQDRERTKKADSLRGFQTKDNTFAENNAFTDGEEPEFQGSRKLDNLQKKAEKAGRKTEAARKKLPKKKEYSLERVFDEKTGRAKYVLTVVAKEKPFKEDNPVKRMAGRTGSEFAGFAHGKVAEVEKENSGVEGAHKTEQKAEDAYRFVKRHYKNREQRQRGKVAKLEKKQFQKEVNFRYQKFLEENPEMQEKTLKKQLQKRLQKQRIKREYAKARRAGQAAKNTKEAAVKSANFTTTVAKKLQEIAAKHTSLLVAVGASALLLIMIMTSVSSCGAMFSDGMSTTLAGSYMSVPAEIDAADLAFSGLEMELQKEVDSIETDYPDYDEYRYNLDPIGHDPFALISYLSAVHTEFTAADVQSEIEGLFDEMYELTLNPTTETRTRTVTKTGTRTVTDPVTGEETEEEYEYEEEEEYTVTILEVTLTAKDLNLIAAGHMDSEQKEIYALYNETHGLTQQFYTPLNLYWYNYVSSYYGYRINPVTGAEQFHRGVDIAVPTGTTVLAAMDGTVTEAAYDSYYGNYVVIEDSKGYPNDFFDVAVGNVPFGQYKVADRQYDKNNFLIHDYFFAKTLDKVRPGGVVAFVTSKGTMDKKSPEVRKYLAQRAELLGAVRLPNTAFKENAGTEVTSDILFLKKRDRVMDLEPDWVHLSEDANGIAMNSYFAEHPEMIVGKMEMVSGPYGMESTCQPDTTRPFAEQLAETISRIAGEIEAVELDGLDEEMADQTIPADPDVKNYSYTLVDDKVYYRENSVMKPVDMKDSMLERIKGMVGIRDCTQELINVQLEEYPDTVILEKQAELNKLYDDFSKRYGLINSQTNKRAFNQDSSYCLLCSLEKTDEEGKFVGKADMFTKRTIKKAEVVTSVDTATEALAVSLSEKARVDLDYMAELSGKDIDTIKEELTGVIFQNPVTDKWETADEYLSGNVRDKLETAKIYAENHPEYAVNVQALTQVQPKELDASEIEVRIGATWVKPEYLEDFMRDTFETPQHLFDKNIMGIQFSGVTGQWNVKGKNADFGNSLVNMTYGTSRRNAYQILEDSLNLKDSRVYDTIEEDGKEKRVLNKKETTLAAQKQDTIREAFKDWVFRDPDRRQDLVAKYNKLFNSTRPREYDGAHLKFPGMTPDIELKPHQKSAVAHVLYGDNTLLAHCVGAGKTFEMTAAAMESKRLGLSKDYIRLQTQGDTLEALYEKFNIDHPEDFKGHSLSVSDIVALHENGKNSAHFVDSFGFTELPDFIRALEGVREQGVEKSEPEEMQDTSGHDVNQSAKQNDLKPDSEKEKENTPEYIYKMEANPRSDSIENRFFLQAYEVEGMGRAIPRDVLYVGTPEKCHELLGQLVSGEMTQSDVKEIFVKAQEALQEPEQPEAQKRYPDFYGNTLRYAMEHGEVDSYSDSRKLDRECKRAVEETIRQNFDGMHLNHDIVKPLAEQYGSERMAFVLANTIQQESWDGRFSRDNKAWASEFSIPEDIVRGTDMNLELIVSSHPAVLDGFIGMFRREVLEQEKEMSARQEEVASGHDVQKLEPEQPEPEQTQAEQPEAEKPEPQAEQSEPEKPGKTPELGDMDDEDEIIDLGDERDQVLAEMKQSLEGRQDASGHDASQSAKQNDLKPEQAEPEELPETELAFQIADRYISIQETDGGYDYSIMGADYKEIDGGVYDNPDVSIREALNDIVEDLKENPFDNGARGNIDDNDELIPIDYDGLMEKVEAANCIEPQTQGSVVQNFKSKTNELFHEISEMNPAEIEETVKCHVQAKLEECGIDAVIVDAVVSGSRCRGLEREGSDLDVVVELSTNEREDVLFDMFNEDGLHIGGVKVDINPITAQRTGSLETYLPQVEDYLEGVREARENEPISIFNIRMNDEERWFKNTSGLDAEGLCKAYAECDKPFVEMEKYGERIEAADHAYIEQGERLDFSIEFNEETDQITIFDGENFEYKGLRETLFPEQAEQEVTLTVAECGEFHNLGEFYENIPTVAEAVAIWKQIPPERMNGIPAIGINLHTPGTEAFEDVGIDILTGKRIDLAVLEYIPDIKGNPQAMEVIAELVAKAMPLMPEMEIDGSMSKEFEAKVWEKRIPDLPPVEQLAVEIDRFTYDYDTALYHDNSQSMTENVSEIAEALKQRDTHDIALWLAEIAADGTEPEERNRAMELLEKLAEYKPLAKIEEMEEQNYNMVDNVLNNGAGEKAQKEENKKEQERPAARTSLKARLAEKKAIVSGQGKDHETQENIKNNQREM